MTNKDPPENSDNEDETDQSIDGLHSDQANNEMSRLRLETISVTISQQTIIEITNYSIEAKPKEAIGLLSGIEVRSKEIMISKGIYVTQGDEYSVSFSDEDFQVFDQLSGPEFCVGWWHSHPGYGLFLSQTDITTHVYSFQLVQPLSVALVVDPNDVSEDGIAKYKFFQVVGNSQSDIFQYREIASYLDIS
ncbi:hypothetical protein CEE45_00025 [Candidatus Heimdallarchaeota archaeon B3_Heim]|nr:MAG: hypothetical protein CEE45_00025 [Candidatus Heimdallarchaeota archaeon B3_Heim]